MSDIIDIDQVDLEALVDKTVSQFQGQYDAMTDPQKSAFKDMCRGQIRNAFMIAENVRQETLDNVLRLFDVVAPSNNIQFIRDAIVRFKKV